MNHLMRLCVNHLPFCHVHITYLQCSVSVPLHVCGVVVD